jgi:hypothetical protein
MPPAVQHHHHAVISAKVQALVRLLVILVTLAILATLVTLVTLGRFAKPKDTIVEAAIN